MQSKLGLRKDGDLGDQHLKQDIKSNVTHHVVLYIIK